MSASGRVYIGACRSLVMMLFSASMYDQHLSSEHIAKKQCTPAAAEWHRRRHVREAVLAVVLNSDLVALILRDNIGPSAFQAASLVCKSWLAVCRTHEQVLRGAALYTGAVTKGVLIQLFAISSNEANALPRAQYARKGLGGGHCYLYRANAITAILADGGLPAWRRRLRERAEIPRFDAWHFSPLKCSPLNIRQHSAQEERLHAMQQHAPRVTA
jgi:hypothetical protein